MTDAISASTPADTGQRDWLLPVLAFTTFVIFFQAYMVAPTIPLLSQVMHTSEKTAGLVVPAYLIPYGISTLLYGVIADRFGVHRVMLGSLAAFCIFSFLTAAAQTVEQLIVLRIMAGLGASGIVPLCLTLVGRLYPYEQRGRALGWLFGAMAGGMAFGSPLGAILASAIGWQGLFICVGLAGLVLWGVIFRKRTFIRSAARPMPSRIHDILTGYKLLLANPRGARTYLYVLLNAMFHSGVFTWLGLYLEREQHLGSVEIGLSLLGYGIPGFLLGPAIGRLADKTGRARLIPMGLLLGSVAAFSLCFHPPVTIVPLIALVLSLGYDMTQPLFGGIVTALGGQRAGQAMGLNVFTLFVGLGLGSVAFGILLPMGFAMAFAIFAVLELLLALVSISLFSSERPAQTVRPAAQQ